MSGTPADDRTPPGDRSAVSGVPAGDLDPPIAAGPPIADPAAVDLAIVADDLAGALDPARAAALHALLAADPAAADRYADFARTLEGVGALLAAQPVLPVPDDVVRRLDAAFQREVDADAAHRSALTRSVPGRPRSFMGRTLPSRASAGRALAGLVGVAAAAGIVAVIVHGGGASGASSSAGFSAAMSSTAAASAAGSSAAAGSGSKPAATPAAPAARAAAPTSRLEDLPVTVTAKDLPAVVRTLYARELAPAPLNRTQASPAISAFSGTVTVPASCRPAGVAGSVSLLAARTVRFAGHPAVLLVLRGPTDRPGAVRATVVAACGGPALLSRQVTAAG